MRCAAFVSLGGFIFGWVSEFKYYWIVHVIVVTDGATKSRFDTGLIGLITLMPEFEHLFGTLSPTLRGIIVSMILIPASVSSLDAGLIADRISRTYAISLGAGLYALGSILQCISGLGLGRGGGLAMLLVGRTITDFGEGIFLSPITVYAVEVTPVKQRGRVTSLVQLFICTGMAVGYFFCYGSLWIPGSLSWRLPFVCQTLISSIMWWVFYPTSLSAVVVPCLSETGSPVGIGDTGNYPEFHGS